MEPFMGYVCSFWREGNWRKEVWVVIIYVCIMWFVLLGILVVFFVSFHPVIFSFEVQYDMILCSMAKIDVILF